jgi:hypothetical protein
MLEIAVRFNVAIRVISALTFAAPGWRGFLSEAGEGH